MENENKNLTMLLIILGVVALASAAYFGYLYMNKEEAVDETVPATTEVVELTQEEVVEKAEDTVTDAIDEIVADLESLETEEDFEDFDAELEFGVAL